MYRCHTFRQSSKIMGTIILNFKKLFAFHALILSALALAACEPARTPNPAGNQSNVNTAIPSASPAPSTAASPSGESGVSTTPITLPVLDAMFSDEGFAGDL